MTGEGKCPNLEALQQFSLGQLPQAEAWPLHRHLIRCRLCAETVNELKEAARKITSASILADVRNREPLSLSPLPPGGEGRVRGDPISSTTAPEDSQKLTKAAPSSTQAPAEMPRGVLESLRPAQQDGELGRLADYRVLQTLGSGGMGVVFKAEDARLSRIVALKVMKPDQVSDSTARARFLAEGKSAASIQHDHVVTIYQVGEDNGLPFLAMQFLEGEPLDKRIKRVGRIPVIEILRIGREAALGLQAAHDRGLIHRDIKPGNIWLEQGDDRVKILDFGLARATGDQYQHLTRTGFVMGTPGYMSPEQARGIKLDARSDLFSLGCVLYEMCTGREPFMGSDMMATLMALALESPPPIRQLNSEIPPALAELVMWLLAKSAEDRPRSARIAAESLARMQSNPAPTSIAPAVSQPSPFSGTIHDGSSSESIPVKAGSSPILIAIVAVILFILIALCMVPSFSVAPNNTMGDKNNGQSGTSARK